MREIKYRAWDKDRKEMVKVHSIHLNTQKVILTGICFGGNRSVPFDEIEIMEYTGLKDKNGKEIYEGDILQAEHFSYTGTYGLVVIKLGEYVDTGFLDDSNYEAQGVGFHAYLTKVKETCGIQKDMMQGMVVIGNIHENPELL